MQLVRPCPKIRTLSNTNIVNKDYIANLFRPSTSNHRRLSPILRHLHPWPRRGVSCTIRTLPCEYLEQKQQPPRESATFANKIRCAERKRDARGHGIDWLGPRWGEQEKFNRGRDHHHERLEPEESQGSWRGNGEGETPEDGAHWGCIAESGRLKKGRISVFVYCWNLEYQNMSTNHTQYQSAVIRGISHPRAYNDTS